MNEVTNSPVIFCSRFAACHGVTLAKAGAKRGASMVWTVRAARPTETRYSFRLI